MTDGNVKIKVDLVPDSKSLDNLKSDISDAVNAKQSVASIKELNSELKSVQKYIREMSNAKVPYTNEDWVFAKQWVSDLKLAIKSAEDATVQLQQVQEVMQNMPQVNMGGDVQQTVDLFEKLKDFTQGMSSQDVKVDFLKEHIDDVKNLTDTSSDAYKDLMILYDVFDVKLDNPIAPVEESMSESVDNTKEEAYTLYDSFNNLMGLFDNLHQSIFTKDTIADGDLEKLMDFSNELREIYSQYNYLSDGSDEFSGKMSKDMQIVSTAINEVRDALTKVPEVNTFTEEESEQIEKESYRISTLSERFKELAETKKLVKDIESGNVIVSDSVYAEAQQHITELTESIALMKQQLSGPMPTQQYDSPIGPTSTSEMSKLAQLTQSVGERMKNIKYPKFIVPEVSKTSQSMASLASRIKSILPSLGKLGKIGTSVFKKAEKQSKGFLKKMLMVGLGVRGIMALVRKLRTAVIKSFKDLAKGDPTGDFAIQLKEFNMALDTLKANIGVAFQPIASVVLPILTQLIDRVSIVTNELAKFFAVLTNQGYVYKYTADTKKYADSIKQTGNAAKKANKDLAEYDKLIVIKKDTDSGTSDDGLKGTYSKIDITGATNEFAEMVKDAWDSMDFTQVGEVIGNKLSSALTSIPWDKIKTAVTKVSTSLATLLNGLISPELFGNIGTTIAEGLNTAFIGIGTFIKTFDWTNLGNSLGAGLGKLFTTFDFSNIGKTLNGAILGVLNAAKGLFDTFPWKDVANSLSHVFDGVDLVKILITALQTGSSLVKGAGEFITTIIDNITKAINNFDYKKVDWDGIFSAVINTIITVLKTAGKLSASIINLAVSLIGMISKAIADGVIKLSDSIADLLLKFTKADGSIDWKNMGKYLIDGLWNGIKEPLKNAYSWIKENIFMPIGENFCKVFGIASPSTVFKKYGVYIMQGLFNGIKSLVTNIISIFTSLSTKLGTIVTNIGTSLKAKFNTIKTNIVTVIGNMKTAFSDKFSTIKTALDSKVNAIKTSLVGKFDSIKTTVSNTIYNMKTKLLDTFKNLKDSLKTPINGIIGFLQTLVNGVINTINKVIGAVDKLGITIPDWVPTYGGKKFSFNVKPIESVTIPKLAKGAVIPPNREFLAMLGDQKSGTNIETPLETMIEAFTQALDKRSTNNTNPIVLQLSGRTIAQVVWDESNKRYKQTGNYGFGY